MDSGMWGCLLETGGLPGCSDVHAMQETQVQSLGWESLLEKRSVTHCSILSSRIPWAEKPGSLQSMESQRVRHGWAVGKWAWAGGSQRLQVDCGWISPRTLGLILHSEPILVLPRVRDGGFASAESTAENAPVQGLGEVSSGGPLEEVSL